MMAYGEQTTLAERKRRAAHRLIIGFDGFDVPEEIRRFARQAPPAGYILFRRNVEEPAQVLELNRALVDVNGEENPPILSVDQEGGRVRRIRETDWPPMRWVGNIDQLETTKKTATLLAEELLAMGFNTNWAPVADVDSNPANPIIGDRSFGRSPALCSRHVNAFMAAQHARGIISCIKHFPGHGDTDLDSHLELPIVEKEPPDLEQCELYPFQKAIEAGIQLIMTAHVLFPAYDEEYPATMSHTILNGILRQRFGYDGLIVSDDMEMKAVRGRWPLEQQLDLSCRAGVDLFLICSDYALQQEAFECLVHLQESDSAHDTLSIASQKRLFHLRERFFLVPPKPSLLDCVGSALHREHSAMVRSRGEA
ncbi:MAG: beta-N-acetylhexosaminidase [Myxococcota bacterium]|nr:beta-N-acetylhexosaminidase [Myxococcota bacterium]